MRGKLLFVAGLATGYVFGSRAGRQRYEQIKSGWLSFYNTAPVQSQVTRVQGFAKARVSEVPALLATGVRGLARAISNSEPSTTEAPARATSTTTSTTAATKKPAAAAKPAAKKSTSAKPAAAKPAAATKPAAKKPAAKKSTSAKTATASGTDEKQG